MLERTRRHVFVGALAVALLGDASLAHAFPVAPGPFAAVRGPRAFRHHHHHHHHHSSSGTRVTEPEPDTTPPAERFDLSLKLEGGYELGALDGRGTGGPRWGVGLGAQNDEMGWWITLRGRLAEPSVGVHAWDARLGVDADVLRAGITHIGVGSELGVMGQPGPTGATRPTFTCGLGARAGLDLVRFGDRDRSALTLDLRGDVQVLATSGSYATIALLAAVRF